MKDGRRGRGRVAGGGCLRLPFWVGGPIVGVCWARLEREGGYSYGPHLGVIRAAMQVRKGQRLLNIATAGP